MRKRVQTSRWSQGPYNLPHGNLAGLRLQPMGDRHKTQETAKQEQGSHRQTLPSQALQGTKGKLREHDRFKTAGPRFSPHSSNTGFLGGNEARRTWRFGDFLLSFIFCKVSFRRVEMSVKNGFSTVQHVKLEQTTATEASRILQNIPCAAEEKKKTKSRKSKEA